MPIQPRFAQAIRHIGSILFLVLPLAIAGASVAQADSPRDRIRKHFKEVREHSPIQVAQHRSEDRERSHARSKSDRHQSKDKHKRTQRDDRRRHDRDSKARNDNDKHRRGYNDKHRRGYNDKHRRGYNDKHRQKYNDRHRYNDKHRYGHNDQRRHGDRHRYNDKHRHSGPHHRRCGHQYVGFAPPFASFFQLIINANRPYACEHCHVSYLDVDSFDLHLSDVHGVRYGEAQLVLSAGSWIYSD